jgi:hypothetical protein
MIKRNLWRTASLALALVVLATAAGAVLAVTSQRTAKGSVGVTVVREDSTTASATSSSTVYSDIPGARMNVTVTGTRNNLLVARFQGHGSVIQTSGCMVRIVAGATTMEPASDYAFMSQANVSGSSVDSGSIERSIILTPGTYTVRAQLRISTANNVNSQCQLSGWHFLAERFTK